MAHGSRDPRAAATVEDLLELVRESRPGLPVRAAYLDHAPPTLAGVLAGRTEAAVLPLLLDRGLPQPGGHSPARWPRRRPGSRGCGCTGARRWAHTRC